MGDTYEEERNQAYLTDREFSYLYSEYERTYFRKDHPHALLLYAKSYFIKQKYQECIDILHKIEKCFSTKVLFERQALLFKASYLKNPDDIATLTKIVAEYEANKSRCPGKPLTRFHHAQINQLLETITRGHEVQKRGMTITKQNFKAQLRQQQKRPRFQGLPSYLVSVGWNKKFNNYLLRQGPHPGPITNFQLINHIFQLIPQQQPHKDYLNKLLFPLTQQDQYYTIPRRNWQLIQQQFSGNPIKRLYVIPPRTRQISGGDHLVRMALVEDDALFVLQWQSGGFWEKSVIPALMAKFGDGQLKEQTRNKDYLVVQPGKIQQPYYPLKYVKVDLKIIKASTKKEQARKKKIISSYDLQKFNPQNIKSQGTGLANLGNTCYMNAAIQFITNLKTFINYFLTNKYLPKINLTDKNKQGSYGQVLCAYADLVKRMWFSCKDTKYVDPSSFKRAFGNRHSMFVGNQQEDAQEFLMFLLSCLHEDLNQNAQINQAHRQSMGGKTFSNVRNIALDHYKRHNKSIISDLFHGFLFEEIMCDECKSVMYRFENYLMLHVQAPPESLKISVYMVQAKDLTETKKIQVFLAKLKTVEDVEQVMRRYFSISPQNKLISFLYYDQQKLWQILPKDKQTISIHKQTTTKSGYYFIHQYRPPQADQQLSMISYHHEINPSQSQLDGFPRFVITKICYQQKQYYQKLIDLVFSTIPKKKIVKDRSQYVSGVKIKSLKSKVVGVNYRVAMAQLVKNYQNISIERVVGENQGDANGTTLEACLTRLSNRQVIQQWKCQKCQKFTPAHKTDKIYSTSKYLIIQIKRFTQTCKIYTKIDYPINNLSLCKFISKQSQPSPTQQSHVYNLQSVILHRGSLNSGHYTCIARNIQNNGWMYFDDQNVRDIAEDSVVDANAYMLVYEKVCGDDEEDFMLNSRNFQKMGLGRL